MMQTSTAYTNEIQFFLSETIAKSKKIEERAQALNASNKARVLACLKQIDGLVNLICENNSTLTTPSSPRISRTQDEINTAKDNINHAQTRIDDLLRRASEALASEEPVSSSRSSHLWYTESSSSTSPHTIPPAISSPPIHGNTHDQMGDDTTCSYQHEETIAAEEEAESSSRSIARVIAVATVVPADERIGILEEEIRTLRETVQALLRTTSTLAERVVTLEQQQTRAVTSLSINTIPSAVTSPSVTSPQSQQGALVFSHTAAATPATVSSHQQPANNTTASAAGCPSKRGKKR